MVTLQFTFNIEYYVAGWMTFTKPTTTLLPGIYPFRFAGAGLSALQTTLTIDADEIVSSVAYIRLIPHHPCLRNSTGDSECWYECHSDLQTVK